MKQGFRQQLSLRGAEHWAVFDQVHITHETNPPQYPQRIAGQRSPPRSEFSIYGVRRPPCPRPNIGQRGPNQFPEHLMDFGRSRKITGGPQRVACCIIMGIGGSHIVVDADRTFGGDKGFQLLSEAHATLAVPAVGSIRSRRFFAVAIR